MQAAQAGRKASVGAQTGIREAGGLGGGVGGEDNDAICSSIKACQEERIRAN